MGKPREEAEREADRRRISDLYLRGWNQTEIGHELGIDQSTVSRDIKTLKGEWRKQRNGLVEEFEAKYRLMYKEAYAAWLESKKPSETTMQEYIKRGDIDDQQIEKGGRVKVSTRTEKPTGNPALLAQAQAALKAIREMFGVDTQKTGTDESPFVIMVKYGERSNGTASQPTREAD